MQKVLCDYGCGQEARYVLGNGKCCCSISPNSCPEIKHKNSIKVAESRKNEEKFECPICHRSFRIRYKEKHIAACSEPKVLLQTNNCWYQTVYNQIILKRSKDVLISGYFEIHHIVPVCLGGTNKRNNLIKLTAREHYICHALLARIYKGKREYYKLLRAFICMNQDKYGRRYTSRLYEYAKKEYSKYRKEELAQINPSTGVYWITNKITGEYVKVDKNGLNTYDREIFIRGRKSKEYLYKLALKEKRILDREQQKKIDIQEKRKLYTKWYQICNKYGYKYLFELINYKYSKANMSNMFKKYADGFVSQNGKKRISKT